MIERQIEQPPAEERPAVAFEFPRQYRYQRTQEGRLQDDRARARFTVERLRYRAYERNGTLTGVLQRTRALAARWMPWLIYAYVVYRIIR